MNTSFFFRDDDACVEPAKRMVNGRYGWAIHRFPIKGGKTMRQTVWPDYTKRLAANVTKDNAMFRLLSQRTKA